jgi:hypothetical protein
VIKHSQWAEATETRAAKTARENFMVGKLGVETIFYETFIASLHVD